MIHLVNLESWMYVPSLFYTVYGPKWQQEALPQNVSSHLNLKLMNCLSVHKDCILSLKVLNINCPKETRCISQKHCSKNGWTQKFVS